DYDAKRQQYDWSKYYHRLLHGTSEHGLQWQLPTNYDEIPDKALKEYYRLRTREPITYYHRRSPVGQVMDTLTAKRQVSDDERRAMFDVLDAASEGQVFVDPLRQARGLRRFQPFVEADFRLPCSLVGLGAVPLGPVVGAWSEPPCAVIGLGGGTMAAYARPYQHFAFYEIDGRVVDYSLPGVKARERPLTFADLDPYEQGLRAAGKKTYFTYLHDALKRGAGVEVILGDARLSLGQELPRPGGYYPRREGYYHVFVGDALSSDAIPVHLLTT